MIVTLLHIAVMIATNPSTPLNSHDNSVTGSRYLVVFFDPTCHFCLMELPEVLLLSTVESDINPVLIVPNNPSLVALTDSISRLTGIPYLVDEGQWETAEVQSTPTIGVFYESTGQMYILSEGYLPADSLRNRLKIIEKSLPLASRRRNR